MSGKQFGVVVMAGGFGSRLAPLTNSRPKPMLPIYNRSVLERVLDLLVDNGFENAAITTMYLPEQIERVRHDDIELSFFREMEPKGSAGAVRAISDLLSDTVLIISGDAVCNFNLKKHLQIHIERKRQATMLLTKTKKPLEFGTVLKDIKTNRISRFIEKPSWADTLSNLINTGIYILNKSIINMIPEGRFYDFGRDLFPMLLKKKVPVFGLEAEGYWRDIGSFSDFHECNMRFSKRRNVIGKGSEIDDNAEINESILFENIKVGSSKIEGSIIGEGVIIGDGCNIPEGCVIGAETVIGDRVGLAEGVRITNKIKIGRGARIMGNAFMNSSAGHLFGDEGINGKYGKEIDGELCFKLGYGLSSLGRPARIGVMSDGSVKGHMLADSIMVGARSAGGFVLDLEEGFIELASFSPQEYDLDCCVYLSFHRTREDETVSISLFERNGLKVSREKQRKIENSMREKLPASNTIYETEKLTKEQRVKFRYCHYLQGTVGNIEGVKALSWGKNEQANFFFSNAKELGAETELLDDKDNDIGGDFFAFFDDRKVSALSSEGNELSFWQLFILAAQCLEKKELYLPQSTPETVEEYLLEHEFAIRFYNDSESEERKNAFSTHFYNDGVLLALMVCRYMRENNTTLDKALEVLPAFFIKSIDVDVDDDEKADLIGVLATECEDCSRGVRFKNNKGRVSVYPRAYGGFRVFAEAVNAEFADELCDFAAKKIWESRKRQ